MQARGLGNETKRRQQTTLLAWASKRQKGTSSPNTLDEVDSNDEEQKGHTTTESANGDDEITSTVRSSSYLTYHHAHFH